MPLGRSGSALELVTDVEPTRLHVHDALPRAGQRPDRQGPPRAGRAEPHAVRFEERYHLTKAPWKWFEGPIYRFINQKNEASMRRAAAWLTEHPEYRPDLVEP